MAEKPSGAPQTWSEWISFIFSIFATLLGVLTFGVSYITLQRDRPQVSLALRIDMFTTSDRVQSGFPDVKLAERAGHSPKDPGPWYLLIVTNRGNRPIHFLGASVHASRKDNPWLATYHFDFDKTLTETNRSATLAVPLATMDPGYQLDSIELLADDGQTYSVARAEAIHLKP